MAHSEVRRVYLAFEFEKDVQRRATFISQAKRHCAYQLDDLSLPAARHPAGWRLEARARITAAHVVIVLLGQDTYNAPGVRDELSLAGQARRPVVQLMPHRQNYGRASSGAPLCPYRWRVINRMLSDPEAFVRTVGQT